MGEEPERVFNVGAIGIENILNEKLMSKEELGKELNIDLKKRPYAMVTFHPVTLEENSAEKQIRAFSRPAGNTGILILYLRKQMPTSRDASLTGL